MSAYASYEHGILRHAVFINLDAWLQSSSGDRPSVHIDLVLFLSETDDSSQAQSASATAHSTVEARRLVIQHADDVANLTWAGQSYETSDVQPSGPLMVEQVDPSNGFDIRSTEAVLITFP